MIKEIMLASALTLAQPPYPHFYNVNNDYGKCYLDFGSIDYQHYNSYIINLNNGTTEISNLSYVVDGGYYQKSLNTTTWVDSDINHLHDYLTWTFYDLYDDSLNNISHFFIEIDFESIVYNYSGVDDEIVIDCYFAIPGEDDSTLFNISGTQSLIISPFYNYAYIYAYDWLDVSYWLTMDNSYLVLNTDTIEGNDGNSVDFDSITLFFNYSNIGLGYWVNDDAFYLYGTYSNFIYNNMYDWLDYALELEEVNSELRQENEELNSRHALTNVFEIVRGAFDGVVNFLEIELMPNLTIGTIIFIPVVIGVIFFILKALVL